MIEFKDVTKVYEGTVALNQLNLTLQSGEIVGLNWSQWRRKIYYH